MDLVTLLLSISLLFGIVLILFSGYSESARLINKLPGPPTLPLIGNLYLVLFKKLQEAWEMEIYYIRKYQPMIRGWLGTKAIVSVSSPELIEVILNNYRTIDKPFIYRFLHPWLGTGLLTATETAMGTPVHAQENENPEYVDAIHTLSQVFMDRLTKAWLYPNLTFRLSSLGRTYYKCIGVLHNFTDRVIQERKLQREFSENSANEKLETGKKKRLAFLDMLLDVSEGGTKLADEEIREEVDTFMFEGHDTTATAICYALYLLGLHPEVQDRAYQEQENIFQGSDRTVTMKDLNDMQYLERVIKESLRLYPSVPEILREINSDIKIGGHTLPAGTVLHVHMYVLHRNPHQFPNPEKFDPDNFLPERVAKRHPYAYIPFSAGPRNCIGQKFALLEEKTVLSYMLRHYELRSRDSREDIKVYNALILRMCEGFNISVTPRKKSVDL
ncbi:cytochrome P450 4C1 isoform X2 [Cryptotermes secundus]|uniref:cytochrome P450 4C1 isoform X2 n=1 Tax=Cryptotermes secundus TaxID=105785 RepID=UPI000CD7DC0E|nr:cytochrome P450 4C1 isoform X2 [Cryptotermes secundus]